MKAALGNEFKDQAVLFSPFLKLQYIYKGDFQKQMLVDTTKARIKALLYFLFERTYMAVIQRGHYQPSAGTDH